MADAEVGAAQLLRDVRMQAGQPLYVRLVDQPPLGRVLRPLHPLPVEIISRGDDAERAAGRGVTRVRVEQSAVQRIGLTRLDFIAPDGQPADRPGVRVEQYLGRIAAVTGCRIERAVHPVGVQLPGPYAR